MSTKLKLPDVTLLTATGNYKLPETLDAFNECCRQAEFGDYKMFTSCRLNLPFHNHCDIETKEDYSKWCITQMPNYVKTSHVLIVQWDGYIINPQAWTNEYLEYDYIGSPWPTARFRGWQNGNGGFCLRSKKLLDTFKLIEWNNKYHYEDNVICITHRKRLEDCGIKFAPIDLCKRFSVEHERYDKYNSFGFHRRLIDFPQERYNNEEKSEQTLHQ